MADDRVNTLLKQYKETGDIRIRNEIAEKYLYIADIIAKKFVGRGVEFDDLKQVASLALLRGIERFDPDLGMQFTTFITPTIAGEIKNYFRDKSRMVKLPRRLGEITAAVKNFTLEYEATHGAKPNVKTIAEALSYSEEDVVHALEVGNPISFDTAMAGDGEERESLHEIIPDHDDSYEKVEMKETLRVAMKNFSDTERALIRYRFEEELSQTETAKRLGVSQMFVSRMERKLLAKLKESLQDSM
ncbi:MAG: sigma-70 family RNA polymerase sigma factor [Clostridia bacterium]|nr:sigma-70 family RNA polymerase sigma factor [Clostridia bacterium]